MAGLLRQFFFIPAATLTEENCPDQTGRVFIVTGGYSGVGFELSKILYTHSATVYIAGRSQSKATAAIERIQKATPNSTGHLKFLSIDLSDLKTVKQATETFLAEADRLDVLVNNAGVLYPPAGSVDAQGYDLQIGTNCLGPALLYQLLAPVLSRTAASSPKGSVRVAWAGSIGIDVNSPKPGGMILDTEGRPEDKGPRLNYAQSKVGNLFLAHEYAQRSTAQSGVLHVCFNPGNLRTEIQRHWKGLEATFVNKALMFPAIYGAYTELWASLSPELKLEQSGMYVVPWGRIAGVRKDVEAALKPPSESEASLATKFVTWCDEQIKPYR